MSSKKLPSAFPSAVASSSTSREARDFASIAPLDTPPPIESLSDLVAYRAAQKRQSPDPASLAQASSSPLHKTFWFGNGSQNEPSAIDDTRAQPVLEDDEAIRVSEGRRRTPQPNIWERARSALSPLSGLLGQSAHTATSRDDAGSKSIAGATRGSDSSGPGAMYERQAAEDEAGLSDTVEQEDVSLESLRLSTASLAILTAAVAGAQMAWCLELAFGTPYLLSLGLSKSSTSLVWLAGPVSGLIAQPLVGSMSDRSTSRFRRRKYMLSAALVLSLSTLLVAFSRPLSELLADITGVGMGDWDPTREKTVVAYNQSFAIVGFWILDLSLNALQAASRALILDVAPSEQQSSANAWQGRMTALGNLIGYSAGWLDLGSSRALRWVGGGQFRKLALVALTGMLVGVGTTCLLIDETKGAHSNATSGSTNTTTPHGHTVQPQSSLWQELKLSLRDIWQAARRLPRPVRRVCMVQLFAFMGWFPLLFYASSYIAEVHAAQRGGRDAVLLEAGPAQNFLGRSAADKDAERGSKALLLYSLVALVSGTLLPYVALASDSRLQNLWSKRQPLASEGLTESTHLLPRMGEEAGLTTLPKSRTRLQRIAQGIREGVTLRTMWTCASLLLATLMAITFLPLKTTGATVLISMVGIPWAVASWVPFALVMEQVHEAEQGSSPFEFEGDYHGAQRTAQRRRASMLAAASFHVAGTSSESTSSDSTMARTQLRAALNECGPLRRGDPPASLLKGRSSRNTTPSGSVLARGGEIIGHLPSSTSRHAPTAASTQGGSGGTILGIHNLAIVFPQFVVAVIASLIFKAVDRQDPTVTLVNEGRSASLDVFPFFVGSAEPPHQQSAEGVAWVLRFGGLMSLCAALLTRFIPLTRTERARRGEILDADVAPSHFDDEVGEDEAEDEQN
ncbi:Sucrose transporter and related proteins [Ceraceosorus bombacis]|uniref:Sucrose transporter and related proteins n=1 Tax=Ceraceosorus bombacis TaxID=401625 RepID=A0A0P1BBF7_9BASI|nr:Sucrose transporter and related proteins [Ceraceosorus bombacis]